MQSPSAGFRASGCTSSVWAAAFIWAEHLGPHAPHIKGICSLFCLPSATSHIPQRGRGLATRTARWQTRQQTAVCAKMQASQLPSSAAAEKACSSSTGHTVALRTYWRPAAFGFPPSCLKHGVPPSRTGVNTHTHTLQITPDYIDKTKKYWPIEIIQHSDKGDAIWSDHDTTTKRRQNINARKQEIRNWASRRWNDKIKRDRVTPVRPSGSKRRRLDGNYSSFSLWAV